MMDEFDGSIDDLLSDGDSFFDDPKTHAKKSTPKKTAKAAADIFGFDKDVKSTKKDDWLGLGDDKVLEKEPASSVMPKKKIDLDSDKGGDEFNSLGLQRKSTKKTDDKLSFDNDDDITNILGLSSSSAKVTKKAVDDKLGNDDVDNILGLGAPPKSAPSKKSSILSDILGETKKEEKSLSFDDILSASSIRKKDATPIPATVEIKEEKKNPPAQNEFLSMTSRGESRRGRRNSQGIIDPLGIFDTPSTEVKEDKTKITKKVESKNLDSYKSSFDSTIRTDKKSTEMMKPPTPTLSQPAVSSKSSDLPNWLGGKEAKSSKTEITMPEVKTNEEITEQNISIKTDNTEALKLSDNVLESLIAQQKISSSNLGLQNASLALQQQESQLMIAVQLKKYEENLASMQRKQQEILTKQDVQFSSLLEQQFTKQQTMENNMRLQQERINNHIKLLMSQSSSGIAPSTQEEQEKKSDYLKATFEENRKFYDDIIQSLKQKHQEEIFLLEESYKKQLTFLENSLESTEQRLKAEIENINKHFHEKIEDILKEKQNIVAQYEEKIKQINEQNLSEIDTIKEQNKITVTDIRNEYKQMIEDIAKSKSKEQEILLESGILTKRIDENVEMLNGNTQAISEIQTKFSQDHQILLDMKRETLSVKEQEIKMMQSSLEKQRIANDAERAQLLTLVRTLETRVAEQTQTTREERWALQQATATLVARSAALDRESEFAKHNLEREREQLKALKESLLAENEIMVLKLTEEKLAISAERARLETSAKLTQNFDKAKANAEIEAALKVAKEATELTDRERENLCKKQCEIEMLKRTLQDRESKLKAKENDLDKLFRDADEKYRDGEKALNEAKLTEHKYNERLRDIQKQLVSLTAREKKLTEEKISLSKERLSLHTQLKDNKKCGLCEVDNYNTEFSSKSQNKYIETNIPMPSWGTDAEILRIKYDLDNENIVSKEHSINENDTDS